ncbi:hypothetical protein PHYSODRAFT_479489 [Phytophthora sojae]|uniref:Uncharacterized protein n=1 Tax=Phytophthora sojae (strain P6497) TaxID=1094619 RepID=G4YRG5_PHYSP|nr:hypothetical protein PHYSODRAFT_479489 [Phytophthora sojae]EGZ22899.1 hypothetical protein PHYSODRAFT_479489 [Phytophthora sojae]|eukprot:XP_009518187.1 hypothetical protein PHYSODRAFT_479489 [Phytophthora sojae]
MTDGCSVFTRIWRDLLRDGWTAKRPSLRSLDTRNRYIPPGGGVAGQEGRDFF